MSNSFEEKIKLKDGLTEDKVIEKLNKALESYADSDFDGDEIIYLDIESRAAKQLFEELFTGVSFEEYIKYYGAISSVDSWRSCQCDISDMLNFLDLSNNIRYSFKKIKFYKNMDMLSKAITIATKAHNNQIDKAGQPYILHPLRVMLKLSNDIDRQVAILHDVIEDTNISIDDLRREGFENNVLKALSFITRKEDEKYFDYINKIKQNYIAKKVKIADLEDNMNLSRIQNIIDKDLGRMKRYVKAYSILKNYDVNDIKIEKFHKGLEDKMWRTIRDIPIIITPSALGEQIVDDEDIIMTINKERRYIVSNPSFLSGFNEYEKIKYQ